MASVYEGEGRLRRTHEIQAEHDAFALLYLAGGERSGSEMRDALAVRCGSMDGVTRARSRLMEAGLAEETRKVGPDRFYRLTPKGVAAAEEAKKVLAQRRAERRAA